MAAQKFAYMSAMALMAAAAATPAAAYDSEGGETIRAERNWNGSGGGAARTGGRRDNAAVEAEGRNGGSARRGGNGTGGSRSSGSSARGGDVTVIDDGERRDERRGGRTGEGRNRGNDDGRYTDRVYGRHGYHAEGLDRHEAARIARSHREAPGHVVLRRDRYSEYYNGMPSYRTPHHRRRWWRWGW